MARRRVYYRDHLGRFVNRKTYGYLQSVPGTIEWAALAAVGVGLAITYSSWPSAPQHKRRRQATVVSGSVLSGRDASRVTCPRGRGCFLLKAQQRPVIYGQRS